MYDTSVLESATNQRHRVVDPKRRFVTSYNTAIEANPQRLQASKQFPNPSLPERIEQLRKQNSSLNYEAAHYRDMEQYRR
ncbi:hypothetical protein BJ875DRAFT_193265 [Amylocarpus encephaloides]|uniref:Uncharacterized protein n=1 Tax=Amylocarpus encephaloides TaxID=45428 RepID=A0A9P7YA95_9HELO|nr:hypothetical protein BJ875DRAFT_193265 [Amylocarpus encephaloides]